MYKTISFIITTFCLLGMHAQEIPLYSAAHGVFIQIHDVSQAYQALKVERQHRSRYKQIAILRAPASERELRERYDVNKNLFPLPLWNEESSLATIWRYISQRRIPDSLSIFRHPAVQIAMGLAWLDREVENGALYGYQLKGNESEVLASGQIQFFPNRFEHEAFVVLRSSRDDELPSAEWGSAFVAGFADYQVFRRTIGEVDYQRILPLRQKAQSLDSLRLIMTDTTVEAEAIYEYYVVPMDRLGNLGQGSPRVQAGNFSTRTQPFVYNFQANSHARQSAINLSWSLANSSRVRSLKLFRSRHHERGFSEVQELAILDSSFTDLIEDPGEGYFYYLQINDITAKDLRSVTIFGIYTGSQFAEAPGRLLVQTEQEGIRLNWQGSGEDIRGYYVYRGKGYRGELKQISPFISAADGPSFLDTARLSGSSTYSYAVKAESKSYSLSDFSERVAVRPQNPTQISPPMSLQCQYQENQVRISWDNLSSREAHLDGYFLFRKTADSDSLRQVNREKIPLRQNYYYDEGIEAGHTYQYTVRAVDAFGALSSLSKTSSIEIPLPDFPQQLGLQGQPDGIALRWHSPSTSYSYQVQVYRTAGLGDTELLDQVSSRQNSFLDRNVKKGVHYTYQLIYVDQTGNPLRHSELISIRY